MVQEKVKAIELRKKGYTYNEIMELIPVAKSSLSLWLKDLPLTSQEKKSLKRRKDSKMTKGRIRAVASAKEGRLKRNKAEFNEAKESFEKYKSDTLFQIGISLYWAEGAKRSNIFHFMNSDDSMIDLMLKWLEKYQSIGRSEIYYRLYLHKPYAHEKCEDWWADKLKVPRENFKKTIFKPSGLGVKIRPNYMGCLRLEVPRSTKLFRQYQYWQSLLVEYHRKG